MTEIDEVVWKNLREEIINARKDLRKAARSMGRKESTRVVEHYADAVDELKERIEAEAERFAVGSTDRNRFLALCEADEFPWRPCLYSYL
jgi:hypothetical protein